MCACVSKLAEEYKKRAARYRSLFGVFRHSVQNTITKVFPSCLSGPLDVCKPPVCSVLYIHRRIYKLRKS